MNNRAKQFFGGSAALAAVFAMSVIWRNDAASPNDSKKPQTLAAAPEPSTTASQMVATQPAATTAASSDDHAKEKQKVAEIRSYLFDEEPNTWSYYEDLLQLYRSGILKDEIFSLLQELETSFPGSTSPREALGHVYAEEGKWDLAKPYITSILEYTDRPFTARLSLATAEFETADPEAAIAQARALKHMMQEYASKKRDVSLLKEGMKDGHLWMACLIESLALARIDQLENGKKAMRNCAKDITSAGDDQNGFNTIADHLEVWQDKSLKEVIEILD